MGDSNEERTAPAGWYPHPSMADTRRYWDGVAWTDNIAPADNPKPVGADQQSQIVWVVLLAASVVGVVIALQPASLLTGTSTQWVGAAIALASGCATYVIRKSVPNWLRGVSVLAALVAFGNVVLLESQLEDKRQEISNLVP